MTLEVKLLLIVFAVFAFIQSYFIVSSSTIPLGVDWNNFHSKAVEAYARDDISYLLKYPPAFELLFVPLVWLNLMNYALYLQIIFYVLAIVLPVYFVYKIEGFKIAVIVGFLLLASGAYLDRAIQLNPETLELSLFPLAVLLYTKRHYLSGSILLLYFSYAHYIGFVFTMILIFYSILIKSKLSKYLILVFILSIPSMSYFIITFLNIFSGLPVFIYTHLPQQSQNAMFLQNHPIPFIFYFGMFSVALLPFLTGLIIGFRKRYCFYLIWIAIFTPLFFVMIDRWVQYILLPLSILEGVALTNFIEIIKKKKGRLRSLHFCSFST